MSKVHEMLVCTKEQYSSPYLQCQLTPHNEVGQFESYDNNVVILGNSLGMNQCNVKIKHADVMEPPLVTGEHTCIHRRAPH